jgi:23S rRNA (guanosine2251-2'-O)-methyltransferase
MNERYGGGGHGRGGRDDDRRDSSDFEPQHPEQGPMHPARRRAADPLGDAPNSITVIGRRSVQEALDEPGVQVLGVRMARELPGEYREKMSRACREKDVELQMQSFREIGAFTGDARNDQGIAARIRLKKAVEIDEFLPSVKGQGSREPAHVLALDGVTNPQNVGMIVRSAVASGVRAVLWPSAGSPWVDALIVKASAGTVYRCPIVRCRQIVDGLLEMQRAGFRLYGLEMDGGGSLFDVTPVHRSVVIVGGETTGLSESVRGMVDERLSIPMAAGVESLNAAVAASLVCFEFSRKRVLKAKE